MGKTVYLRTLNPNPALDIYDTIAGAIAALDLGDCTDAGAPGTVVPLDSASYGPIHIGARNYVDIAVVAGSGCAPTFTSVTGVVTTTAGAVRVRIIGDPGAPGTLVLDPGSGSGSDMIQPAAGCSVEVSDFEFDGPTGTAKQVISGAGTAGDSWTFTRFHCLGGSWASPVIGGNVTEINIIDCNWLAMVDQTGPVVTSNVAVVVTTGSKLIGGTWLGSMSSLGTPASRHTLNSTVLVKEPTATFLGLIDLRASAGGHSIGADIYRVTLIGDGAADQAGFYSEYTTADVKGCIVQGFARGWHTTGAWSPSYSTTYDCTNAYFGSATAGTGMLTSDPLLDSGYRKSAGSLSIDAGTVTGITSDVDGYPIPFGVAEDIGADESQWVVTTYTGRVRAGEPKYVYATDLGGEPLPGFDPFVLLPETPGDSLVNLAQIILIAVFSDRLALDSDAIPDGTDDRRGWWGDSYNVDGLLIGSRLWLAMGQPMRASTANTVKSYIEESTRFLVTDGLLASVEIETEAQGTGQDLRMAVRIVALRGDGIGVRLLFPDLWATMEG